LFIRILEEPPYPKNTDNFEDLQDVEEPEILVASSHHREDNDGDDREDID